MTFSALMKNTVIKNNKTRQNGLMRQDEILMVRRLKAANRNFTLDRTFFSFCLNKLKSKSLMFLIILDIIPILVQNQWPKLGLGKSNDLRQD